MSYTGQPALSNNSKSPKEVNPADPARMLGS